MSYSTLAVGAYTKLHELIESRQEPPPVQFLGYDFADGQPDFIYDLQESDFTRELVNTFNEYAYWLHRVSLWDEVLRTYPEADRLELQYEFTTLPLDYCLHAPYKFRSQVAFCATQLCYTKAIAAKLVTKDSVQPDEKVTLGSLIAVAHHWSAGPKLVEALKQIDGENYRQATFNYRNRAQHRHPLPLHYGHTSAIVRSFPANAKVSYAFGESPPLTTSDVFPALAAEGERMRTVFVVYRSLVEEQSRFKSET